MKNVRLPELEALELDTRMNYVNFQLFIDQPKLAKINTSDIVYVYDSEILGIFGAHIGKYIVATKSDLMIKKNQ